MRFASRYQRYHSAEIAGIVAGVMAAEHIGVERFPFGVPWRRLAAGVERMAGRADSDKRFAGLDKTADERHFVGLGCAAADAQDQQGSVVEGKGTLADDVAAANAVMEAVATFDPAAVPIISLIEMAEPTFEMIAGLVKSGAIQGGYPDIIGEENSTNFRDR